MIISLNCSYKSVLKFFLSGPGGDDSEARASLFNLQVDYDSLQDKYDILLNEKVLLDKEIEEFRSRIGEIEQELGKSDCSGCILYQFCIMMNQQISALNQNNHL